MATIAQIYQSLGKESSRFEQPLPLAPLKNDITPWNSNRYQTPRKNMHKKPLSGIENMMKTTIRFNKTNKTINNKETLKRTSYFFDTSENFHQDVFKAKKIRTDPKLSYISSSRNMKRIKIKTHNQQQQMKKCSMVRKLSSTLIGGDQVFNHTMLALRARNKSVIETRSKNIQLIRHISQRRVDSTKKLSN